MRTAQITSEIKDIIEKNPISIATVMKDGNPNGIGVASVKVVSEDELLVTDNYMHQTIEDIRFHPQVAVLAWNNKMMGYKLIGHAEYFHTGPWVDRVRSIPENKGYPVKGAILITVDKIIPSA